MKQLRNLGLALRASTCSQHMVNIGGEPRSKSPLETTIAKENREEDDGVLRETYLELMTIEVQKKSVFCYCFKRKSNQIPRIVQA